MPKILDYELAPRETKIGSKNRRVLEIGDKAVTVFDWREGKRLLVRVTRRFEKLRVRLMGIPLYWKDKKNVDGFTSKLFSLASQMSMNYSQRRTKVDVILSSVRRAKACVAMFFYSLHAAQSYNGFSSIHHLRNEAIWSECNLIANNNNNNNNNDKCRMYLALFC